MPGRARPYRLAVIIIALVCANVVAWSMFVARPVGSVGASEPTGEPHVLVAAPAGVSAVGADEMVTISWEALPGAVDYELMRDGEVLDAGQPGPSYEDWGLDTGIHTYRVRGCNELRCGPWSPEAIAGVGLADDLVGSTVAELPGPALAEDAKVVALTFDDGPDPRWTPRVLDVLAAHGAHATFFMVGDAVIDHPELVRDVVAAGHSVASHSMYHDDLVELGAEAGAADVALAAQAITAASGTAVRCVRPPYGSHDVALDTALASRGFASALWSVDPTDWDEPGVDEIVSGVLDALRPGSVVLLHDGGGDRSQTVEALEEILTGLASRGFETVSVC